MKEWLIALGVIVFAVVAIFGIVCGGSYAHQYVKYGTFETAYTMKFVENLAGKSNSMSYYEVECTPPSPFDFGTRDLFFVHKAYRTKEQAKKLANDYMDRLIAANCHDKTETLIRKHP